MGRMRCWAALVAVAAVGLLGGRAAKGQVVVYVNAAAPPGGNGLSWQTAFNDVQAGLDAAGPIAGGGQDVQVWVTAGTYTPRTATQPFQMINRVAVLGGFAGAETMEGQRDPASRPTVLSGDLLGDDDQGFGHYGDNALNIVQSTSNDRTAVLDGLTVTHGKRAMAIAAGSNPSFRRLGIRDNGRFDPFNGDTVSSAGSPRFDDCVFSENAYFAFFSTAGSPEFWRCEFSRNVGSGTGTGASLRGNTLLCVDCVFADNLADGAGAVVGGGTFIRCSFLRHVANFGGGAVNCQSASEFRDCYFESNRGGFSSGGAVYVSGAQPARFVGCEFVRNRAGGGGGGAVSGPSFFVNCQFRGNEACLGAAVSSGTSYSGCVFNGNVSHQGGSLCDGGAVYANGSESFVNCTFFNNRGVAVYSSSMGTINIANSVFWRNQRDGAAEDELAQIWINAGSAAVTFCFIQGRDTFNGPGNIGGGAADPMLADPDGPDDVPGTVDDNLRLWRGSPCIDSANSMLLPMDVLDIDGDGDTSERLPLDLDLLARRRDDPLTADTGVDAPDLPGVVVDMGAYELTPTSFWTGGNGMFGDPGHWIGGVPGLGTRAAFDLAGPTPISVMFGAFAFSERLIVGRGRAVLELGGRAYVLAGSLGANVEVAPLAGATEAGLLVRGGTLQTAPGTSISVERGGFLGGDGILVGDVTNSGTVITNRERPHVPGTAGILTVDGDYSQIRRLPGADYTGTLNLGFGETGHDQLVVTGTVELGGSLVVDKIGSFDLQLGESLTLLSAAGGRMGTFDAALMPRHSAEGLYYYITYATRGGGSVVLNVGQLPGQVRSAALRVFTTSGPPEGAAAADFTGDGFKDLALTLPGNPGSVIVLQNLGTTADGTWNGFNEVPVQEIPVGPAPGAIAAGNFGGDARPDLAVVDPVEGTVRVLTNNNGMFSETLRLEGLSEPRAIAAGRFEGAGDLSDDLAVAEAGADRAALYFPPFGPLPRKRVPIGPRPIDVRPWDPNTDKPNPEFLVLPNSGGSSLSVIRLPVPADPTPAVVETHAVGSQPVAVVAADLNGDGMQDLAVVNEGSNDMSILSSSGVPGELAPAASFPLGANPLRTIAALDPDDNTPNGDGDIDLLFVAEEAPSGVAMALQNNGGDPLFAPADIQGLENDMARMVITADLDNDGRDDIITLSGGARGGPTIGVRRPKCRVDWNRDGARNSADFFEFLGSFFAGQGEFNLDGVVNSSDFFDFLAVFFDPMGCG